MTDDFKKSLEMDIEEYANSISRNIMRMVRHLKRLEEMGDKLSVSNDWEDFIDVIGYIEHLQKDSIECNKLIQCALDNCVILRRYNERCGDDE